MKLALSTQGRDANSPMDLRFGRARFFRIVDSETGRATVLDSAAVAESGQGAGIQAVQALARSGVQAVLTGQVGPKAWAALRAARIEVYPVGSGSAEEILQSFFDGRFRPLCNVDLPEANGAQQSKRKGLNP